jgi:hypothetical protein
MTKPILPNGYAVPLRCMCELARVLRNRVHRLRLVFNNLGW